jgi:CheY-like chemotaxis protein
VRQIFANLLANAAKYTPEGGEIRLASLVSNGMVSVSVADNGIGLAPDVIPRLFDPFFQAPQGKERTVGGLGVGLALVQSLTQLQGGGVRAESPGPGKGSTFTVQLPLLPAEGLPMPTPLPRRAAVPPLRQLSVLVVDDNADAAEALADAVRMLGHRVTVAHDGAAALEECKAQELDLALVDIGLPVMDGHEVARRLRGAGHAMTLVAVTGYGTRSDVQQALSAGFDAHHTKPIDLDVLAKLLAACQQRAIARERRGQR